MKTLTILFLFFAGLVHAEMDQISDVELDDVTGQAGVAVSLDWRLSANQDGSPLSLCTNAATYRECRVAWAFNNRGAEDVNNGKRWLVLKGFTGGLFIPYLSVDASQVTYTRDAASGGGSKTIPAILVGFGAGGSGATTKVQVKNLKIDNIAMENDTTARRGYWADATLEPTGAAIPAGVNTGFMGLQINGPSNVANVQIDGTIKLFPCLGDHPSC